MRFGEIFLYYFESPSYGKNLLKYLQHPRYGRIVLLVHISKYLMYSEIQHFIAYQNKDATDASLWGLSSRLYELFYKGRGHSLAITP